MVIKGYINIQMVEKDDKVSFYTGCDIHPTIESAKGVASKNTIQQIYIAFDTSPERERKEKDMSKYYAEKELAEERVQIRTGEKSKRRSRKPEC